jgi:hypothetical protein
MAKKTADTSRAALAGAKRLTMDQHFARIRAVEAKSLAEGGERGACLITDAQTGQNRCIRTTEAACKAMKGVFIGGPCGG